jgi:protein TonB
LKEIDMLAYAAHRRHVAERRSAPHLMLGIIAAHITVIAAVMSAKLDLPERILRPPIKIKLIPIPVPPPPNTHTDPKPTQSHSIIDRTPVIIPVPRPADDTFDPVDLGPTLGPDIGPRTEPRILADPVRVAARFATPASAIRPPYPPSKINSEEEAVLKLRLSIDPIGRVVAVEPIGRADPAFLASARRHLMAKWRYAPATVDGRAIASETLITLRFELD